MMRTRTFLTKFAALAPLLAAMLLGTCWAQAQAPKKLPYIYTQWKNFTVADGLPSDHIFSVKIVHSPDTLLNRLDPAVVAAQMLSCSTAIP